jgi:hypothetical protein
MQKAVALKQSTATHTTTVECMSGKRKRNSVRRRLKKMLELVETN